MASYERSLSAPLPNGSDEGEEYVAGWLRCNGPWIRTKIPKPDLKIEKVEKNTIRIAWNGIEGVKDYKVACVKKFKGNEQRFYYRTSETKFSIPGVFPGCEYEISVGACEGEKSDSTTVVVGPSKPTNVNAKVDPSSPSDSIVVSFEEPDQTPESYEIVIVDSVDGQEKMRQRSQKTFSTFRGLDSGRAYDAYVQAVMSNPYPGAAELFSKKAYASTEIRTCPAKATIERAKYLGNGAAKVEWKFTEGATEYQVQCTDGGNDLVPRTYTTNFATIRGLAAGKIYFITVAAKNKAGKGPLSDPREISTEPLPPAAITVTHSPSSPHVTLLLSLERNGGEDVDGKKFDFIAKPLNKSLEILAVSSYSTNAVMNDLAPGETYQICALERYRNLTSKETIFPHLVQMYPDQPVEVQAFVEDGNLQVSWKELDAEPTRYLVEIEENGEMTEEYSVSNKIIRRNVRPSRIYQIRVAAINDAGRGHFSKETILYSDPAPPSNPRVTHNKACPGTSLIVSFEDHDFVRKRYEITAVSVTGQDAVKLTTNEKSVILNDLCPGQMYRVQVVCLIDCGDGQSRRSAPVDCLPK